jgi:hypothetical protein
MMLELPSPRRRRRSCVVRWRIASRSCRCHCCRNSRSAAVVVKCQDVKSLDAGEAWLWISLAVWIISRAARRPSSCMTWAIHHLLIPNLRNVGAGNAKRPAKTRKSVVWAGTVSQPCLSQSRQEIGLFYGEKHA